MSWIDSRFVEAWASSFAWSLPDLPWLDSFWLLVRNVNTHLYNFEVSLIILIYRKEEIFCTKYAIYILFPWGSHPCLLFGNFVLCIPLFQKFWLRYIMTASLRQFLFIIKLEMDDSSLSGIYYIFFLIYKFSFSINFYLSSDTKFWFLEG